MEKPAPELAGGGESHETINFSYRRFPGEAVDDKNNRQKQNVEEQIRSGRINRKKQKGLSAEQRLVNNLTPVQARPPKKRRRSSIVSRGLLAVMNASKSTPIRPTKTVVEKPVAAIASGPPPKPPPKKPRMRSTWKEPGTPASLKRIRMDKSLQGSSRARKLMKLANGRKTGSGIFMSRKIQDSPLTKLRITGSATPPASIFQRPQLQTGAATGLKKPKWGFAKALNMDVFTRKDPSTPKAPSAQKAGTKSGETRKSAGKLTALELSTPLATPDFKKPLKRIGLVTPLQPLTSPKKGGKTPKVHESAVKSAEKAQSVLCDAQEILVMPETEAVKEPKCTAESPPKGASKAKHSLSIPSTPKASVVKTKNNQEEKVKETTSGPTPSVEREEKTAEEKTERGNRKTKVGLKIGGIYGHRPVVEGRKRSCLKCKIVDLDLDDPQGHDSKIKYYQSHIIITDSNNKQQKLALYSGWIRGRELVPWPYEDPKPAQTKSTKKKRPATPSRRKRTPRKKTPRKPKARKTPKRRKKKTPPMEEAPSKAQLSRPSTPKPHRPSTPKPQKDILTTIASLGNGLLKQMDVFAAAHQKKVTNLETRLDILKEKLGCVGGRSQRPN